MIINNNIPAMNTHRQMGINQGNMQSSMEKLSSGMRINKAGDDAAGLAISEKMRAQINGLDQASRNAQDGISMIQTAEGALDETHNILQRMRELAVQSSNDTNTEDDREEIQKEMTQLTNEIDRIGTSTEFNTKKLLNGGASVSGTVTGAAADQVKLTGGSGDTQVGATASLTAWTEATADTSTTTATSFGTASNTLAADSDITVNGVKFSFTDSDTVQDVLDTINDSSIGVSVSVDGSDQLEFKSTTVGSKSDMTISSVTGDFAGADSVTEGADASVTMTEGYSYTADGNDITVQSGAAEGLEFSVEGATGVATISVDSNGGLNMHIGANEDQTMYVSIGDMRANALGVSQVDVTTTKGSENAITTINDAIQGVSGERSKLGSYQNRLEHTISNLDNSSENLSAAESRIRDVDMAKEMMEMTSANILSQASQSMLAQANQQPQAVLQLLG